MYIRLPSYYFVESTFSEWSACLFATMWCWEIEPKVTKYGWMFGSSFTIRAGSKFPGLHVSQFPEMDGHLTFLVPCWVRHVFDLYEFLSDLNYHIDLLQFRCHYTGGIYSFNMFQTKPVVAFNWSTLYLRSIIPYQLWFPNVSL